MTELELEELLSDPYPEDDAWDGDLLLVGAGGKMGPSLAHRAVRAHRGKGRVIAVSRFSDPKARAQLEAWGVETIAADLFDTRALAQLPDVSNVIYMAARKFGTGTDNALTWATNAYVPGLVAERYEGARIVAFSTGNVYPLTPVASGGATESTPVGPIGEYAQSALARERVFEYFSHVRGTALTLLRLNYAVEPRYGVLCDIARKVWAGELVDVTMGHVNVIWQGDANSVCLRSLALCSSPPFVLNLTGMETLSVRSLALEFGKRWGRAPRFTGSEAENALLSNATLCAQRFGPPRVSLGRVIDWVADWVAAGGPLLGKPTHFEVRDGKF